MIQHHRSRWISWQCCLAFAFIFGVVVALSTAILDNRPAKPYRVGTAPGAASREVQRPIQFVANHGQIHSDVAFTAQVFGGTAFFTKDEIVLALPTDQSVSDQENHANAHVVRLTFQDADPQRQINHDAQHSDQIHLIRGTTPAEWHTRVPAYESIRYGELYAGIDLRFDGSHDGLKGTYVVSPGADPRRIRWQYSGAQTIVVDSTGALQLTLAHDDRSRNSVQLRESAPIAWQEVDGRRERVDVRYDIGADKSIGFRLSVYDHRLPLIIDPEITYSTYVGGSASDTGFNVWVDKAGYVYVAGETFSTNFPVKNAVQGTVAGNYDFFVSKIDPANGDLVFSTYLGGSADDRGRGIAVDDTGAIVVVGHSVSIDFPMVQALQPTADGIYQEGVIARLEPDGASLSFSTYIGGNYWDQATRVAVDREGRIYVVGATASPNLTTTTNAFQSALKGGSDAFVATLPPDGSEWDYLTYLGGGGNESAYGVAVDTEGQAFVVGRTDSADFSVSSKAVQTSLRGGNDVFVSQLAASGNALVYSTYLGGSGIDVGHAVALSADGGVYVVGDTTSTNFPVSSNAPQPTYRGQGDTFVTKIIPHSPTVAYSSYLGGSNFEEAFGVAVSASGDAYVIGTTSSSNFPVVYPLQPTLQGGADIFVTQVNPAGTQWQTSTFIGGQGDDIGRGVAVGPIPHQIVITGETQSAQGIQRCTVANCPPPLQATYGGSRDGFIIQINTELPPPTPTATSVPPTPTATSVPPTPTATSVPPTPTATSVPPLRIVFLPMITEVDPF